MHRALYFWAALATAGCHRAPPPPSENPYREPARAILERRCGDCHRADAPRRQARALAVFTLNDVDFAARMSDTQLGDALGRFTGEIAPRDDISDEEARTMAAFVGAERARRGTPR
jgi:hypothetical protein